ncbi:hypothetical protein [Dyadobacter bucti]|uniref:hypothetical protein n=1 Tax=Dyadobacter bucti TaxID=2572203 RepID=UPI001108BFFA|nr:hypothetical protein [Dyadobacter bucti]
MEQITLIKPDGSQYPLQRGVPLTSIEKAEQVCDLLGQDIVNISFKSTMHLEMQLGMKILVFGRYYTLNVLPEEQKVSERDFRYICTFEGVQNDLMSSRYFDADATGFYRSSDFSLTGNLELFIDVLIYNCNRTFGTGVWLKGSVQSTDVKTLTFSSSNCLAALQQTICKEFEVEFEILQVGNVKTLNVQKAGQILNDVYEYGRGRGLYTLTRRSVKETTIVTRLYPYGSSENLPAEYRNYSPRLKIGEAGSDYIEDEAAIAAFGLIEGDKIFEEVKPSYEGTVTAKITNNYYSFQDIDFPFDLLEKDENGHKYLVNGKSPKIHFNTGNLAGYEFELAEGGYNHETFTFTIIGFKDEKGMPFPNTTDPAYQIDFNDKYVLVDIIMPEIYVTKAEAALRTKAQLFLDANKAPLVQYSLDIDPKFLKGKTSPGVIPNFFDLGDYIQIKDKDLNIDKASRVTRFTRNILEPFKYVIEIADSYQVSTITRVISDVKQLNNIVTLNDLRNPIVAKQNWKSARETINEAFDPDGYLKDGKIRAESLEAAIALFGTEGQQFQIINSVFMPNYLGDKNQLRYTAGQLVHLTIEPEIRTWNFNAASVAFGDNTFKYIYAKCPRQGNAATILFGDNKIKTKEDPVYYHFLLGILNSVDPVSQTRQMNLTYGFTLISGRWITTGEIRSSDGSTGFNLDTGELYGNLKFRAANGINKSVSQLETEVLALIDGIAEQTDGQVENWFLEGAPTLTNEPAINWTTAELKEAHIGDNYFDNLSKKSYRFRVLDGTYSWEEVTDDRITQALLLASQAKDTADGKRRVFISSVAKPTPFPPYDVGDLWTNGTDLFVCKVTRLTGSYNGADWDDATIYDNTVTAINGGIAVTGSLYLANEDGTIRAGIQGGGSGDNAIRLFLGASQINQAFAPLRAFNGGHLEIRNKLELFNSSNVGVGGICGINSPSDGNVLAWFGPSYANRATAPSRFELGGKLITALAKIGGWEVDANGLTNQDGNGYIIARSSTASNRTEAMIGANVFPSTFGGKGAAIFRAEEAGGVGSNFGAVFSAKNAPLGFQNFAIYASSGKSMLQEGLLNGRATYEETISTSITRGVDPSLYDFIAINPTAGVVGLGFLTPSGPIANGKEVCILNANNAFNDFFLVGMIRGASSFRVNGGVMVVVRHYNGNWYQQSNHDNNW